MKDKFFEERSDQSEIKARIVQKYFYAWANVVMPTAAKHGNKIAYIDLYAGPGRYKDGAASTPLLVLEKAIADPKMSKMLVALFNDMDANHSNMLKAEIAALPGISKLTHEPQVLNGLVDEENEDYVHRIDHLRLVPAAVRFLSLEPLLGPLDDLDLEGIQWAIAGGESGPHARPMNAEWVRSIRDQCIGAGVAFHFKQWGGTNKKKTGRTLDGRTWDDLPRDTTAQISGAP